MADCKQLSGLNPLSITNNKNERLRKSRVFPLCNKHTPKLTIHQNSAASKALLEKFWFVSWQLPVYIFANITQYGIVLEMEKSTKKNTKSWGKSWRICFDELFCCSIAKNNTDMIIWKKIYGKYLRLINNFLKEIINWE